MKTRKNAPMKNFETITLKLRPILDLVAATPLKTEFVAARGHAVSIDASEVDRVGGLCLQVLLSARSTWAQDGLPFAFRETSAAFEAGLGTLGASFLLASNHPGAPS